GLGDFYVNLFLDVDWLCLVKVNDLMFGELIVEFYDDSYFDDEDVDWIVIG
ncbi:phage tail tube protein, partial [Klebsiella pneumoniae]|uniref:phage tail tube protein n=1 Tax=Klebsiella pneumoniae TaxID=573 RepID=UPI003B5A26E5